MIAYSSMLAGTSAVKSSVWLESGHRFWLIANNNRAHNGNYVLSNGKEAANSVYSDANGRGRTACMWKLEYDQDDGLKPGVIVDLIALGHGKSYDSDTANWHLHSNMVHMDPYGWSWGGESKQLRWKLVWEGDLNVKTKISIVSVASETKGSPTSNWCTVLVCGQQFSLEDGMHSIYLDRMTLGLKQGSAFNAQLVG
jgi:hypothetical protein